MVVHIKNRKTQENAYGPYQSMATARRGFNYHSCDPAIFHFDDEDWRTREASRDNLIDLTAFGLTPVTDHFLHLSVKDNEEEGTVMVSFTLNEAKGRMDRQESGRKIGRYLKEFYPSLSDDDITRLSGEINGRYNKAAIRFAFTQKEIRDVYIKSRDNCSSCMTYRMNNYSSYNQNKDVYPVEAYAGPDLAIAYTVDRYDRVTARAIVWPDKKLYGRVYGGDPSKFRTMLNDLGYRSGDMRGARLTPIEIGRSGAQYIYAMPYIDGDTQSVSFDDEWFYIGYKDDLEYYSTGTSGYIALSRYMCAISNKRLNGSNAYSIRNGLGQTIYVDSALVGGDLYNEQVREFDGRTYFMNGPDSEYYTTRDGTKFPAHEVGRSYTACAFDGQYSLSSETFDGVHYSNLIKHYSRCEMTGRLVRKDDTYATYKMAHGAYWSRAAFRAWGYTDTNGLFQSKFHNQEQLPEAA